MSQGNDQSESPQQHGEHADELDGQAVLAPAPQWAPATKIVVGVFLVLGAFLVVWMSRGILGTLALSGLIAFLVAPLVRFLHKRARVPRGVALIGTYVLVLVFTVVLGVTMVGSVAASLRDLDPGGAVENARTWLLTVVDDSNQMTVFGARLDLTEVLDPVEDWLRGEGGLPTSDEGDPIRLSGADFGTALAVIIGGATSVVALVAAVFTSALVTALIAIYLNMDSRRFHQALFTVVPPGYEGDSQRMAAKIKEVWTGYMYGQLINSIITALMVWAVLAFVGLPGAFVMAMFMLILNMIPTIGPILAAVPGVLAALIQGSDRLDVSNLAFALIVTGIYVVVTQLQSNLIAPRVMGSAVNLRPAVIMIGLLVGLQVGGLLGSLLAVPVIATGREVVRYLYLKLIDRDPWDPNSLAAPEPSAAAAN